MNSARRASAAALAALFIAIAAAFPAGAQDSRKSIVFGVAMSLSGSQAREGRLTQEGYDFWARYTNAHGGLVVGNARYPVEIHYIDDMSSPPETAHAIERLVDDEHVDFLFGPYGSQEVFAAAAVAERLGVPLVSSGGAAERTYNQGYRYVFGVQSPARKYLTGIIEFAVRRDPKPRTIAIGAGSDPFSREVQQGAVQSANDHGLRVVYAKNYKNDDASIRGSAAAIVALHPDIILSAGHLQDTIAMHRALADAHADAKLYGYSVGPDTVQFRTTLGREAQGVLGCSQWSSAVPYVGGPGFPETAPAYAAAFAREMGHEPGYLNAEASAAGVAIAHAVAAAGTTDRDAVRAALVALNITTFFGQIRFDSRGVNMYKPMVVIQIQGDRQVTIYPYRLANGEPIYPAAPLAAAATALHH